MFECDWTRSNTGGVVLVKMCLMLFHQNRCSMIDMSSEQRIIQRGGRHAPGEGMRRAAGRSSVCVTDTYESSAKSVICSLALRARISIRWRPSSVWSPLMMVRRRRRRGQVEGRERQGGTGQEGQRQEENKVVK